MENQKVTIDGYDKHSGSIIRKIAIWKDYNDRSQGVVKKGGLKHKAKVRLIKEFDKYVLISFGIIKKRRGYCNKEFIRELKQWGF
jgi:hypothetical protein